MIFLLIKSQLKRVIKEALTLEKEPDLTQYVADLENEIFGFIFLYVPGIILGIAWSQATILLIDKNLGPMEAMKISNKITYGEKWSMFGGMFSIIICLYLIFGILIWIVASMHIFGLVALLFFLGWLTGIICMISCCIYIYNEFLYN